MPKKVRYAGLILTEVTVRRQVSQVTVFLRGREEIRYQFVPIHAKEVVLDFTDGISYLSFNILPVEHRLLKEVRIEQLPQKLRLVFMLAAKARYAIKTSGSVLAIQFR